MASVIRAVIVVVASMEMRTLLPQSVAEMFWAMRLWLPPSLFVVVVSSIDRSEGEPIRALRSRWSLINNTRVMTMLVRVSLAMWVSVLVWLRLSLVQGAGDLIFQGTLHDLWMDEAIAVFASTVSSMARARVDLPHTPL